TLATPGTDIRRGRAVHRISVVISVWLRTFDQTPIFMTRLVDDSGERITGVFANAGSWPASVSKRSCTSCLAAISSLRSSKIKTTEDKPSTDLDRNVFSPLTPFRACSIGEVRRLSTSGVDNPGASVWISTNSGENSGNTSSGVV